MAAEPWDGAPFRGAKALLLCGARLVVLRRDETPGLPWPGRIDLPGGAREGAETPVACALREVAEETGLRLGPERVLWGRSWPDAPLPNWLVAAMIGVEDAAALRLGDEGQAVWIMEIATYLAAPDAIPHQQARVRAALAAVWPEDSGAR